MASFLDREITEADRIVFRLPLNLVNILPEAFMDFSALLGLAFRCKHVIRPTDVCIAPTYRALASC